MYGGLHYAAEEACPCLEETAHWEDMKYVNIFFEITGLYLSHNKWKWTRIKENSTLASRGKH